MVCDDSGSMSTRDGHKLVKKGPLPTVESCTRWQELSSSIRFHAGLAEAAGAPIEFRLLNGADPILCGLKDDNGEEFRFLQEVLEDEPAGKTPLCAQIDVIVENIRSVEKELRDRHQRAAVIIATDGESTDGDVAKALKPLEALPVWLVIRLCTDDDPVVKYWDAIDDDLELEMDVLDDIQGEGEQVSAALTLILTLILTLTLSSSTGQVRGLNPWICYAEPLHRLREFGEAMREMDLLDERLLSAEQMLAVTQVLIMDGSRSKLPHPEVDFKAFATAVEAQLTKDRRVFCPVRNAVVDWVDLRSLARHYGPPGAAKNCALS